MTAREPTSCPHRHATREAEEAERLSALRRYAMLDTPEEPAFDRIALMARDLFAAPVAMVSLIDETRQWFKARVGIETREVPRRHAFCDHMVLGEGVDGVLVVPDLGTDPRFRDNPYVLGEPRFRFYAGAPVIAPGGAKVGTVSALSPEPRPEGLSRIQAAWLRTLAAMVADEFELRVQSRLAREATERADAALAREARLRRAQEAAGAVAFEFGPGGAAEAEPALRALYGLPPGDGLDFAGVLAAVHPVDRAALAADRERLVSKGGAFNHEYRVILPSGAVRWLSARGAVLEPRTGEAGPARCVAGLVRDVTERREAEEARALLAHEVDHRAKNLLAVVQAALRLSPKADAAGYARAIEGRVAALARAHALLAERSWAATDLRAVLERELRALLRRRGGAEDEPGGGTGPTATLEGATVPLAPHAVQPLAMAVHELATNAIEHGALARPGGRLRVAWSLDAVREDLALRWQESGGPPVAGPPARPGFGARLLRTTVEGQLGGTLDMRWLPGGLECEVHLPAARALAAGRGKPGSQRHR